MKNRSDLATQSVDFGTEKSNPRQSPITKITPHHMAGRVEADDCARSHLYGDREASANYYIGPTGIICSGVAEDRRSWASYNRANDHAAITIEVSDITGDPTWKISDASYRALVKLCADICTRYNFMPHFDGTPGGSITMHEMFVSTLCPGPDLKSKITSGQLEKDILAEMMDGPIPAPVDPTILYRVQTGAYKNPQNALVQADKLSSDGFDTYIVQAEDGLYKVQTGAFKKRENADNLAAKMQALGYETYITNKAGTAYKPGNGKRSVEELAKEVIRGDWGNDPYRSEALRAAGYNPEEVQAAVNDIYRNM